MVIKVGDKLPNAIVYEKSPKNQLNIADVFIGRRGVLFAVPGAFTPGCRFKHLPGYVKDYNAIKAKGIDIIACVAVNDPFVMDAFGKDGGADGKIRMLADPDCSFTKSIGMDIEMSKAMGGCRSKRYSMLIEDGIVKHINVEPDGFSITCSTSTEILSKI
ncbi:hypothetical protein LSH36_984g00026 [Paralvinella palmiformis]|uniref:Peroxiredoxin-5 n=1 Tax=Paralvinella palmiformis TaxID=53620 RepID=A0AAD9IXL9_9ANNE|nr:hypothetical protein LSH36_984g00026 [Paralvinella palmiformis]